MRRLASALIPLLLIMLTMAPSGVPRAAQGSAVVIYGGRLLTVSHGEIAKGSILIVDGKIREIGESVDAPPGAEVILADGMFVMPGIVDTHSHIGVYSWPEVEANSDGNEMTDPVQAGIRAMDAVNLEDPAIQRALAGGVTTIQILPGSGNVIGGESITIKLRPGATMDEMIFAGAPRGLKMALGENPKRVYGGRTKLPSTRMGNIYVMRNAFQQAKEYRAKQEAWEKKPAADRGTPPERDLKLETLSDVLAGKVRVHVHSYRKDEMEALFRVADEFGFKIASLQHGLEAYKIADEVARRDIGVATFSHWWGYKWEAWDGIPHNAGILAEHGVKVSIHSDSADLIQRLYTEAAVAMHYGLKREDALKAITLNPAWTLGLDARIGSLDVGKDADIAIFSKDPFDVYTRVEKTLVDGKIVYDRSKSPRPSSKASAPAHDPAIGTQAAASSEGAR
jgi:imidazolonepropionase-like amidohydrolase